VIYADLERALGGRNLSATKPNHAVGHDRHESAAALEASRWDAVENRAAPVPAVPPQPYHEEADDRLLARAGRRTVRDVRRVANDVRCELATFLDLDRLRADPSAARIVRHPCEQRLVRRDPLCAVRVAAADEQEQGARGTTRRASTNVLPECLHRHTKHPPDVACRLPREGRPFTCPFPGRSRHRHVSGHRTLDEATLLFLIRDRLVLVLRLASDLRPVLDAHVVIDLNRHALAVEAIAAVTLAAGDPALVAGLEVEVVGLETCTF
jgi:hypothetical protein